MFNKHPISFSSLGEEFNLTGQIGHPLERMLIIL